jgi:hypothetical protein
MRWLVASLVLISSLPSPAVLSAQEQADTSRISVTGRVVDRQTRKAIPRALIEITDIELSVLTDEEGRFVLSDLRRGEYGMVVSKAGYVASEGDFRVERAGSFELLLTPLSLPDPTRPSKVLGWVTDRATGTPLEGATVAIPALEVRRFTDRRGWFDLDHLDPLKIQALEVYHGYASEMPVEYGPMRGHCGVVLVWLKH